MMPRKNNGYSSLTDDQEALLDKFLAKEELDQDRTAPIPVRKGSGPTPLTYAQSRIWFLEQMDPGTSSYIISTAVRLPFPINESLLTDALLYVWQRHTILQMRIYEENGTVFQEIGDYSPQLVMVDLSSMSELDREKIVAERIKDESKRPFDLNTDPLIRLSCIRVQSNEHIILLTTHHIITDGWSIKNLLLELMQAYMHLMQGQTINQPPLPIQYTDYAAWQQEMLTGDEAARQLAYWQEQLRGPLPQTELPTDFSRPQEQTFTGDQLHLELPGALYKSLLQLSKQTGVTMYMMLLATFKVLLQRHIGQDDIIIGSPVSGRQRPELEPLIGLFLNTLVLRTDLSGSPTFLQVLSRVRQICVAAFANQDVPFEMLLAELQPLRDISRTPFFQIFFNMLEFGHAVPQTDYGAEFITPVDLNARFDVTLYLEKSRHSLNLMLVYNPELFTKVRMEDLLQQYLRLLIQVAKNPGMPIKRYSLLTKTAEVFLPDLTAPQSNRWEGPIFSSLDAWAERQPERTAVSDPNGLWTYQQVAIASSRLAHFFQQSGVQSGEVVAVYGYRCAALVPAVMGILKAGAVVLILDPAYPDARLEQYLALAQPAGWISFETANAPPAVQAAALNSTSDCQIQLPLLPDEMLSRLKGLPDQRPPILIGPDDRACLTFTSGSTGDPKGIIGRHSSLTHFYPWMAQEFQMAETDRFSMLSGLAHDPLQRDIFTAIWVGAEICVPDPDRMWQPGYLAQWLQTAGITVVNLIPSMAHLVTAVSRPASPSSLRLAFFVGEALKRHIAELLKQAYPSLTVINLYGTSETQRAVSYHVVTEELPEQPPLNQAVSIGKGMPGSQLLVLTPELELAGIGELGELYLRSPHLALGYLGDEENTALHFLQNPWTSVPEDRLYRTGDYGRFLPDGQVIYEGRRDMRVNINGFRAELSEIEAVLVNHPTIRAAVVTADARTDDNIQIVAYIVKENEKTELDPWQIQAFVKGKLPLPMVPNSVTYLDKIPLTPNGKIDYRSLPSVDLPAHGRPLPAAQHDHIEKMLLSIWQALLPAANIGIYDDFFALGGHSILAIQLFSRIRDEFGIDLNIGLLFQYSTIAELAEILRSRNGTTLTPSVTKSVAQFHNIVQVREGLPEQPLFFCVHGAGGHVMFMQKWQNYFDHWSIYGLESPGVDGISWPRGSLESTLVDYVAALQAIQPHGPYLLGGYSGGGVLAYEMAQQLQQKGEEVALLVLIDTYHPAISSRPFSWPERLHRLRDEKLDFFKGFWQGKLVYPVSLTYIMNRYVKRGKRVPFKFRRPVLEYFFFKTKQQYKPEPYHGQVLLVRSNEVFPAYDHVSLQLGWDGLLADLRVVKLPGNHFTIVQEPHVRNLAQAIEDAWNGIHNTCKPISSEKFGTW